MSTFEELQRVYGEWTDRHNQYEQENALFVWQLAGGFSNYIGAPASYQTIDRGGAKRYVEPQKLSYDDQGHIRYEDPEYIPDCDNPH